MKQVAIVFFRLDLSESSIFNPKPQIPPKIGFGHDLGCFFAGKGLKIVVS